MTLRLPYWVCLGAVLVLSAPSIASPVDEAKAMVTDAQRLFSKAADAQGEERTKVLVRSATKYARAYALIMARNLKNDAPKLFQQIGKRIGELTRRPEIVAERKKTRAQAVVAATEGRLTDAYDLFARLRDLDPRDQTIEYILGVVGQRMENR